MYVLFWCCLLLCLFFVCFPLTFSSLMMQFFKLLIITKLSFKGYSKSYLLSLLSSLIRQYFCLSITPHPTPPPHYHLPPIFTILTRAYRFLWHVIGTLYVFVFSIDTFFLKRAKVHICEKYDTGIKMFRSVLV
jgi:hypothetical protein